MNPEALNTGNVLQPSANTNDRSEISRNEEEIELLHAVNQATLRGDSIGAITEQVIAALKNLTGLTAINVYLYDTDNNRLRPFDHGLDKGLAHRIEKLTGAELRSYAPLLDAGNRFAHALHSGEYFVEEDKDRILDLMKEFSRNETLHAFIKPVLRLLRIKSLGAVPIRVNNKPVGLITFNSHRSIDEKVVNRIKRFTAEVALAIHYTNNLRDLENSQRRFAFLLNNLDDAVFLHPMNETKFANFLEVNQKAVEIYGYSRKEFLQLSASDLPGKDSANPISHAKAIKELVSNGHLRWRGVHMRKDGRTFPVEVHGNLLELEGQKMIMSVVKDLTGIEETQRALEDSERRYRTLFERSTDAIFTVDPRTGTYLNANSAASVLTGLKREELLKLKVSDVVPQGAEERLSRVNLGPGSFDLGLVEYVRPDGTGRKAQLASIVLEDGTVFGIAHDITDMLEAEEQIRTELANKNALLHEVHHRVRNNLTVIRSLMNLQAKNLATQDDAIRAFEESKNRIFAMAMIHERLYSSGNFSQVDMRSFITQLVRELGITYSQNHAVDSTLDLQDTAMEIVLAVPCGLIMNELISNAIQHGHAPGSGTQLKVSYQLSADGVFQIEIGDQGPGLEDRFDVKKPETLGLYLVNILLEQIDGSLELLDGPGTTFRLEFSDSPMEISRPDPQF